MRSLTLKLLLSLALFMCISISHSQDFNDEYGDPVVVLIETNPWLMVIGSDVPTFSLYENGQIIYRKVINRTYKYFEIKNNRETTQAIIKTFGITDNLMKQDDYTEASNSTDQPSNILILNFDTVRQITVYGNLRDPNSKARTKTPNDFLKVYDNLLKFEDNNANEWIPDTIEVLATNYSHSPETPLKWDNNWNDIKSPTTVKRSDDLYSIYLDKKYFNSFLELIENLNERQAVEINGEKYSLTYRLPFPNIR